MQAPGCLRRRAVPGCPVTSPRPAATSLTPSLRRTYDVSHIVTENLTVDSTDLNSGPAGRTRAGAIGRIERLLAAATLSRHDRRDTLLREFQCSDTFLLESRSALSTLLPRPGSWSPISHRAC